MIFALDWPVTEAMVRRWLEDNRLRTAARALKNAAIVEAGSRDQNFGSASRPRPAARAFLAANLCTQEG